MVEKNIDVHKISVKTIGMRRKVYGPISAEPYVEIGAPLYYMTIETSNGKRTIDVKISKEEYVKLIKFMLEVKQ